MRKKCFFCLKVIAAGILAFVVLNILCFLYYNIPIHISSETRSTDYKWQANKFYSRGTEGFAAGKTDENGFNNLRTFEENEIDVLVMGSSHMEAFNVDQNKNTVALLNDKSKEVGLNYDFYNIGMSGHDLVRCLYNLENAICEFFPQKYVVIETQSVKLSVKNIEEALEGKLLPIESHNDGIIGELQKFPYLRLLYSQINNAKGTNSTGTTKQTKKENDDTTESYLLLNEFIQRSAKICDEKGIKLIIFYNCSIDFDKQGNILKREDVEDVNAFSEICKNNDVIFVDMYDDFKDNYTKSYTLPRGFSNSKVGTGHLNEEGHRIIANRLFEVISNLD